MFAVRFLPESPRWLIANGRDQEALDFLARYHGGGRKDDPVVRLEWRVYAHSSWFCHLTFSQEGIQGNHTTGRLRQEVVGLCNWPLLFLLIQSHPLLLQSELFNSGAARKRIHLVLLMAVFGQLPSSDFVLNAACLYC